MNYVELGHTLEVPRPSEGSTSLTQGGITGKYALDLRGNHSEMIDQEEGAREERSTPWLGVASYTRIPNHALMITL